MTCSPVTHYYVSKCIDMLASVQNLSVLLGMHIASVQVMVLASSASTLPSADEISTVSRLAVSVPADGPTIIACTEAECMPSSTEC